jgi:putative FmdB family regulatory protein
VPLYYFTCDACKTDVRRILTPARAGAAVACPKCKGELRRTPKGATANVIERLDNGLMTKAVERPAEAERLYKERAEADMRKTE